MLLSELFRPFMPVGQAKTPLIFPDAQQRAKRSILKRLQNFACVLPLEERISGSFSGSFADSPHIKIKINAPMQAPLEKATMQIVHYFGTPEPFEKGNFTIWNSTVHGDNKQTESVPPLTPIK